MRGEDGLTDGQDVSSSANQLVRLSRDSQVLPYVCRDNGLTEHQSQKEARPTVSIVKLFKDST